MFLVIMIIVCFDYMLVIVRVSIMFMHRITESLAQCSNGLSSQIVCKRGAYILFCQWMHLACRNVESSSLVLVN